MGRRPRSRPGSGKTRLAGEVSAPRGPVNHVGWTDTRCAGQVRLKHAARKGDTKVSRNPASLPDTGVRGGPGSPGLSSASAVVQALTSRPQKRQ